MGYVLKLFHKIVQQRKTKIEKYLSECQFGFRTGFGTRKALSIVRIPTQRARDIDIFACFVDYDKINTEYSNTINIQNGERQGCILCRLT